MNTQTEIRLIITLAFLVMLSACAASQDTSGYNDPASTNTPAADKVIATCNKAMSTTLSYKTAAQISGTSYDPEWMNLYFSNLPASFEAGTTNIQFFKGQATSDTAITFVATSVPFAIFDRMTGQYLKDGGGNPITYSSFVWNDVKNSIAGVTTAAAFANRVIFVLSLQDLTRAYQVLSVGSYNITGNTLVESVQSLLPTFYANPADYAIKPMGADRETVLKNLHPLKNTVGNYTTLATNLCL